MKDIRTIFIADKRFLHFARNNSDFLKRATRSSV